MESRAAQQSVFLDESFRLRDLVHSLMELLRTPGTLVKMEIVSRKECYARLKVVSVFPHKYQKWNAMKKKNQICNLAWNPS